MNFNPKFNINDSLWEAVKDNYEKGNYTSAIIDSIFFIAKAIREKTDLEFDGIELINKAFSGNDPLIKINSLRTKSEKDEQSGFEFILKGIIQGIRNPRSHDKYTDTKETCDSIVILINYLFNFLSKSKTFDINEYLKRIFDDDFVENEKYADLLVSEIPQKKLNEILIYSFDNREKAVPDKYKYFVNSIMKKLTEEQNLEFCKYASEILKTTKKDKDISVISSIFSNEKWLKIDPSARLRIENKLLKSIRDGRYRDEIDYSGALGTWFINIISHSQLKDEYNYIIGKKLLSENDYEKTYVFKFFNNHILGYDDKPYYLIVEAINTGLEKSDKRFHDLISSALTFEFVEPKWFEQFKEKYEKFKEYEEPNF